MATEAPLGMEFMRWSSAPSITETLAGGNSPLLKTLGLLLAGGSDGEQNAADDAMSGAKSDFRKQEIGAQGPAVTGAIQPPVSPAVPSGFSMQPLSMQPVAPPTGLITLDQQAKMGSAQAPVPAAQDLDGDGVIDNFWGVTRK